MKQYNLIVCGGTFDHFHKGHEAFLRHVFSAGEKVVIGVTDDEYIKKLKIKNEKLKIMETYEKRKQAVNNFLEKEKLFEKVELIPISDLFGPTLDKDLAIDGIIVSKDTKKGADIINEKRKELGLKDLKVIAAPLVYAEDGKLISSERIRRGEIDRTGKLYVKPLWLKTDLILPENLRTELKKPFGKLFKDVGDLNKVKDSLVITVGDITAKILNERSLGQNISVIDFKVARKEAFFSFLDLGFRGDEKVIIAKNPAGHITHDLFSKILNIFKAGFNKRIILKIKGEEDLVVLPLILVASLNTIIYYGQPGQGIVKIEVSEKIKNIAYGLVDRFEMLKYPPAIA